MVETTEATAGDTVMDDDNMDSNEKGIEHKCGQCRESFPSRNQLFKHLRIAGHTVRGGPVGSAGNVLPCTDETVEPDRTQDAKTGKQAMSKPISAMAVGQNNDNGDVHRD